MQRILDAKSVLCVCVVHHSRAFCDCLLIGTVVDYYWTVLRECKPPPRHLTSTEMIQHSHPDFWINLDSDLNICQIAPKMLWIHCIVGISHFIECRENRPVTV